MSRRKDAISADSSKSGMLDTPDGEGCISGISGVVSFARQVYDVEAPGKGALFESEQPRIVYLIQLPVTNKIVATLGEEAGLFKASSNSQGFPFDGHVALFRRGQKL